MKKQQKKTKEITVNINMMNRDKTWLKIKKIF